MNNREWLNGLASTDIPGLNAWMNAEHTDGNPLTDNLMRSVAENLGSEPWNLPRNRYQAGSQVGSEVDSRTQLVADIQAWLESNVGFSVWLTDLMEQVHGWLDRQAAMTERYWREQVDALVAKGDQLAEANAELRDAVEELKAERDEAVEAYDAHMAAHDAWHEAEDITYTRNRFAIYEQATRERITRLESERDALAADLKDCMELNDKLSDEREKWRGTCGLMVDAAHEIERILAEMEAK